MKKQVWYQTTLGYQATRNKLWQSRKVIGDIEASKGRLTFHLMDFKDVTFQITTKGKLGIYYPEDVGYKHFLEQVKPFLVKPDDTPAEVGDIITKLPETIKKVSVKEEKAVPETVLGLINALKMEKNPDVLRFDLKNLNDLANNKSIAHIPNILPFLEKALKNPKFQEATLLKELIQSIDLMLAFERRITSPRQDLIDRIQNVTLSSILQISESVTDQEALRAIISYLGKTDRAESVDAISNIVERVDDDLYHNLKSAVTHVLFNIISPLQNSQEKHINENIRKIIKHQNPTIRGRGIELSNHPR